MSDLNPDIRGLQLIQLSLGYMGRKKKVAISEGKEMNTALAVGERVVSDQK